MAEVTVLFFSYAADRMSGRSRRYQVTDGTTVAELFSRELKPKLRESMGSFMFSVNADWAKPSTVLADGDQLAVIPPVSGG